MAMELTCLGLGKDQGKWAAPSCHLLQVSGAHLLLECPLDLSMLHLFLPAANTIMHKQDEDIHDTRCSKRAADSSMDALQTGSRKRQLFALHDEDDQIPWLHMDDMHGLHARSASDAHTDAFARHREAGNSGFPHSSNMLFESTATLDSTRVVSGHTFLDAEPWYKTVEFGLLDVSSIDAVLISNPEGMLGLPFLTRMARFSGKIYATSVTAKLGQLMMEELVSMHAEYVQIFGRSDTSKKPIWLDLTALDAFSAWMKKALVDNDGVGRANWQNLYGKKDIEKCIKEVHCIHYDEEINIYDCLCIKPCSSGSELGASNWVISGARHLSYFSASNLMSGYSMALNVASHVSSDVLLFCDLKRNLNEENVQNPRSGDDKAFSADCLSKDAQAGHCKNSSHEAQGKQGAFYENLVEELPLVCKAVLDAVVSGGSVLMSISGIGALLEALEVVSQTLDTSNLGSNIPMFFISPIAEEILVYANTVPEWLCAARQEKLYEGEALFGHVELLQQKRLHHLSTVYSSKAVKLWREPCVVFVLDWALRMGPAVPLLHKWRRDPRCLLVLSQTSINAERALAPFQPLTMKVLQYNRGGKLGEAEVSAIIEKLKPELSIVPETMRVEFKQFSDGNATSSRGNVGFYDVWDVLTIPAPPLIEVDMAAEVACQVHPKQLDSGIALSQMTMSVHQKAGRWLLDLPMSSEGCNTSLSAREEVCWGNVKITDIVNILKEHGLRCEGRSQAHDDVSGKSRCEECIIITFPSPAKVELRPHSTLIETDDPIVRQLVTDAVKSFLNFV